MAMLTHTDQRNVVARLPGDVRDLLCENAGHLYLGGGFVRATVAGETPADIDLFGDSKERLHALARLLVSRRRDLGHTVRMHHSNNAVTVLTESKLPVQFITRWVFPCAAELLGSFDFTVCQAAVWRNGNKSNSAWVSAIGGSFYVDLAGRRLVYACPERDEEAGGSMLRAFKYVKRGYSVQVDSLAALIARVVSKLGDEHGKLPEYQTALAIAGLLREVYPTHTVDGVDVLDEHEGSTSNG